MRNLQDVFTSRLATKLLQFLPDKEYIMLNYLVYHGRLPNLRSPQTFSEKIQWIKIFGKLEKYTPFIDKYAVRSFVKKTIGEQYLIPLIGTWQSGTDISFDKLPNKFMLKATHGSGYSYICTDKSSINYERVKKTVNDWLSDNYYYHTREIQYKHCTPRVIAETYFEELPGGLTDYKFFCKQGKPIFLEIIANRLQQPTLDVFDMHFQKIPISFTYPNATTLSKKPEKFTEMIAIAKKLSKQFPFVRVDLYYYKKNIYFGELTFTPGNGFDDMKSPEHDRILGHVIDLPSFHH